MSRIAPTARDEEGRADPGKNPDLDYLLRGTVHDTTARRMGGVAGHAGLFSTAHDVSIFAQALLDRLAGRPSTFPLTQATLQLMTAPQQPGHTPEQLQAANDATREAVATKPNTADPLLAPHYPAIAGQNLRGFGWDIDTAFPCREAWSFPSVASATQALPEPRCGSTRVRIPMSFCSRIRSMCEAVHRSRSCGVTWRRRPPGPWVYSAKRNRPRIRYPPGLIGVDAVDLGFSPLAVRTGRFLMSARTRWRPAPRDRSC